MEYHITMPLLRQPTRSAAEAAALEWILTAEGGLADSPHDPGGITFKGVSLQALIAAGMDIDGDGDVDRDDVLKLKEMWDAGNREPLYAFYVDRYWRKAGCDKLPWPISLLVMDAAVLSGPAQGVKTLQRALGLDEDGITGSQTRFAAAHADAGETAVRFITLRLQFFRDLLARNAKLQEFMNGWAARQLRLLIEAMMRRPK